MAKLEEIKQRWAKVIGAPSFYWYSESEKRQQAPEDIQYLLAEVERLREAQDELVVQLGKVTRQPVVCNCDYPSGCK